MEESLQLIIDDCARGNRLAQETLYRRFYPQLFMLCKRFFQSDDIALHCLNEGMLKVFLSISRFRPGKGSLFNWMYTIVRNTALDELRKQKGKIIPLDALSAEAVSDLNPLERLEAADIYRLLDLLPAATRAIFSLYYLEGFAIKEIACRLTIQTGTVKWHLSDGRNRLRAAMKNNSPEKTSP